MDNLGQRLESHRPALLNVYQQALRETLFDSRAELRPGRLRQIAQGEIDVLTSFLNSRPWADDLAVERGAQLCLAGLSDLSVLRLGQATRQFLLSLPEAELASALSEAIDRYHQALVRGFLQRRERVILNEQEQIRSALQRTLSRFSVQMEVAASVAAATASILDVHQLLDTAVELIRERFDLYYVGLFLIDDAGRWAILQAGTGAAGREWLRRGQRLEIGGSTMIGRCIAEGDVRVAMDVGQTPARFENPLLPETHSEAALPLIARGKPVGALTVQSQRVAAFTDQDIAALRILADQLASGIENARLFTELRRSEEKYRTVLENIEEGYFEMDREGYYTFASDSLCRIVGYPAGEVIGATYRKFIDPEYLARMSLALDEVYRSGRAAKSVEFRLRGRDGVGRFVETSMSLARDAAGQPIGTRGILRDISSRKQAERYMIERRALERSNRELEQFAYVASHDLQEPLRKIQAFGDRLRTKTGPLISDEGRDYLDRMLSAAQRMQTLINDLLTLSRVTTRGQPFVPVDLGQVAREVVQDLEALIDQTRGRVEIGQLPMVEADAVQMRQLLQNLIGNGLKFNRPDVPPVIKLTGSLAKPPRYLKGRLSDSACVIRVEDNGIGFDEKYRDRIFQPFQRLHGRNEYEGTGIGLTICLRIVERHGGAITAQSQPGTGSTFIIMLPAERPAGETTP